MRPRRLELEGFTAFREPTEIDFDGVDLFALTGPTGSGKSSIIDAMVFALYGAVPRHGRRDVAPVISTGRLEMKVRLDFEVAGRIHTVVRVVRRTSRGGANTDEARLESGGHVLAGTAAEVTERVTDLLGLDFDQFTKSVVLPQGEFARFLHDKPSARQDLLVSLLDLGIYEEVAKAARSRQAEAEGRAAEVRSRLGDLADVDPGAVAAAETRVEELTALLAEIEAGAPKLAELEERGREAAGRVRELEARRDALAALSAPEDLDELGSRLADARQAVAAATGRLAEAEQAVAAAEEQLEGLPDRSRLERWLAAAQERKEAAERRAGLEEELRRAEADLAAAVAAEQAAEEALVAARDADLASHLRRSLGPGEECPVCGQVVAEVPPASPSGDLAAAEQRLSAAREERVAAEADRSRVATSLEEVDGRIARLDASLTDRPDDLEGLVARVAEAETALAAARNARDEARRELDAATGALEKAEEAAKRLTTDLIAARDTVASLAPPAIDPDDPAAGWHRLLCWRDETAPEVTSRLAAARAEVEELRRSYVEAEAALAVRCREAGLEPAGQLRDAVVEALTDARGIRDRLAADLERKQAWERSLEDLEVQAAVAKTLARHLSAAGFERWLLDEALRVLADGANQRLAQLAEGRYSLAVTSNLAFEVVDHQAADERRSVRSLSGGETFLVSLALALSLADHISAMAVSGAGRLDSIFLDEGFGTLDAETLETVASVISEIGAGGKMVGLVTHVRDLAHQLPVRFEVRSGPTTATVERVEA